MSQSTLITVCLPVRLVLSSIRATTTKLWNCSLRGLTHIEFISFDIRMKLQ